MICIPHQLLFVWQKSRRMRWAGHVARIGEKRGVYRILVGRPEWKRPIGWCRRRWINYLLTPWSRVLLEKLNSSQLVKKFHAICGTQRFITAFTRARHLSLSWASSIQYMSRPHPTSWKSSLILPSHLCLSSFHPVRDLPACNAVPQRSAPPRAPFSSQYHLILLPALLCTVHCLQAIAKSKIPSDCILVLRLPVFFIGTPGGDARLGTTSFWHWRMI